MKQPITYKHLIVFILLYSSLYSLQWLGNYIYQSIQDKGYAKAAEDFSKYKNNNYFCNTYFSYDTPAGRAWYQSGYFIPGEYKSRKEETHILCSNTVGGATFEVKEIK